jgi:hypothetical protein
MNPAGLKVQQTYSISVRENLKIGNQIRHSTLKLKQYLWKDQELLFTVNNI